MERKNAILEHTAWQTGQPQQDCDMSKSLISESINSTKAFKELHWLFFNIRLLALCDEFIPADPPEYFFDRNPDNFGVTTNFLNLLASTILF